MTGMQYNDMYITLSGQGPIYIIGPRGPAFCPDSGIVEFTGIWAVRHCALKGFVPVTRGWLDIWPLFNIWIWQKSCKLPYMYELDITEAPYWQNCKQ